MPVSQQPRLRLLLALLTLPGYAIVLSVPKLRPNPTWTYNQAIRVHVLRILIQFVSIRRPVTQLSMLAGDEKNRFQLIPPAPAEKYIGCSNIDRSIRPAYVGATWYPVEPATSEITARVILHFHGGAYVLGDGRERDAGFAARCLLDACAGQVSYVLCPQYRLAGNPNSRFPAALQDGITTYSHLILERRIAPSDIIISGDSAGGNLALALVRYLQQYPAELRLPVPGNLWLWSPWLNAVSALQDPFSHDRSPNAATDYTTGDFGHWAVELFAPADITGESISNEHIHPLGNPFSTSASIFICAGECEIFLQDNLLFADQLQSLKGNKVQTFVIPNAPHDVLLMGDKIGFEEAAKVGARAARESLRLC